MKKNSNNLFGFFGKFGFIFLFVLSISNCKEKIEGCLDIEADNFSVSADLPCPDNCCTYPRLSFEIAFRWDSIPLGYNQPYNMSFDTVIKITKTKFYISNIRLTNDAESFKVLDQVELSVNDDNLTGAIFTDDFSLVSRDFTSFDYDIGEIRGSGTFDTLRFFVGLDELANKVEPTSAPDGHPLSIQADSMWNVENAYIFNKLIVIPDTISDPPTEPLQFNITGSGNLKEIVLPFRVDLEVGTNLKVPIIVDYFKWFQGINFEVDSAMVVQKIVNNTSKAFFINE
jgi:MbnP